MIDHEPTEINLPNPRPLRRIGYDSALARISYQEFVAVTRLAGISEDESSPAGIYRRAVTAGWGHDTAYAAAIASDPTIGFPAIRTDATFNRGRCNGNQFEATPGLGNSYKAVADAAGVSTTGKHYCSGLADYPGDPEAWISDRHDVLRVAAKKGMRVSGDVTYNPPEREPAPDVPIAADILKREVDAYLELDSGERRADVEERVFNALTGKVDLNPTLLVKD